MKTSQSITFFSVLLILFCALSISGCKKDNTSGPAAFNLMGTWHSFEKINATYNQQTLTETIDSAHAWVNVVTLQIQKLGSDTLATVGATNYYYPDLCIENSSANNTGSGSVHYDGTSAWYYFWNGTYSVYASNDTLALQCGYGGGGGNPISRVRVFFKRD